MAKKRKSCDEQESDDDITGELSMEEFGNMMDTLAMQPHHSKGMFLHFFIMDTYL
jgi:hypothetical protein